MIKAKIHQIRSNQLLTASLVMIIGSNLANFLNFVYVFVMGRLMGTEIFGELSAIISIIGLLGMISVAFGLVITRYVASAKSKDEISDLITWLNYKVVAVSLIIFLILSLLTPILSNFLHLSSPLNLIIAALCFTFLLPAYFYRSGLQGLLKFKEIIYSLLSETFLKLIVGVIFVLLGFQVFGALIGILIAFFAGFLISRFYIRDYLKKSVKSQIKIGPIMLFTLPVFLQSLAMTSLYTTDLILIKHFFSPHEAGIYASVSTLGKIIFFACGPIANVLYPMVSKKKTEGQSYKRILFSSFSLAISLSAAILLLYAVLPGLSITLLFGKSFIEGSVLLVWFGIFMTFFTFSYLLVNFFLSLGKIKVVIFPIIFAVLQVIGIYLYHTSLFETIKVSLFVSIGLLVSLLIYASFSTFKKANS